MRHVEDDTLPHVVVSHDAALPDFCAAGLELRFHQDDHVAAGVEERWDDREDETQRDERHVDRDDAEDARVWWKLIGNQRSRVHALDDGHSRVAAQPPIELAVADSVEDGTIPADEADNLFICVGVFIHWLAEDDKKIQDYNYQATRESIKRAVTGVPTAAEVVAKKGTAAHPFAAHL